MRGEHSQFAPSRAQPEFGTSHLSIVDALGNAVALLFKTYEFDAALAGRLVDMGINSPAAFEGVETDDLVGAGFTAEEAKDIISRVGT